jgi:beta-fructofuranosidase
VTRDFVTFDYRGVSLPHGTAADPDLNAYTGSVVEADGVHHLFYTGHNPAILVPGANVPAQVVMHATSTDGMQSWAKHPEHTFGAPETGHEPWDWRDPFVFRPDPAGPWRMLLAARTDSGPQRRRGFIAQCVSDDLITWQHAEPFWAPQRYVTHECPDVFQMGDWWYLVYSEFSEKFTTRFRVARTPHGPWEMPSVDTVDGRAFYAAKTAGLDGRRYFVGWIPTKEGDSDDGAWQWAGDLTAHEAAQEPDGGLRFFLPREVRESFGTQLPVRFEPVLGHWQADGDGSAAAVPDGFAVQVSEAALPEQALISLTVDIAADTTECGVVLRASEDADEGYMVRLEPRAGRMVFDRWPRKLTGPMQWQISGDVPHVVELERPADLRPGKHRLEIIHDGTALVAYLDDSVALSARTYDRPAGRLGLFVGEGTATFTDVSVRIRQSQSLEEEEK